VQGAGREGFEEKRFGIGALLFDSVGQAGGNAGAGLISDEGDAFAGLNREAGADGVLRSGNQFGLDGAELSSVLPVAVVGIDERFSWCSSR
jgi:hypothetical protein